MRRAHLAAVLGTKLHGAKRHGTKRHGTKLHRTKHVCRRRLLGATFAGAAMVGVMVGVMVGAASCTKGTGPEIDASVRPGDAHGAGDAGSGTPHDAGPSDGAVDAIPDSMSHS